MQDYNEFILKSVNWNDSGPVETLVKFCPPKLALLKGRRSLRIIDVNDDSSDHCHELEVDITDWFLQEHILWLVLETGDLFVIDLNENSNLKISVDNDIGFKIIKFKTDGSNLFLMSEAQELFLAPYTVKELLLKFKEQITATNTPLKKSRIRRNLLQPGNSHIGKAIDVCGTGLELFVEQGALIAECPLTGMRTVSAPETQTVLGDVIPWDGIIMVTGENCIWLVKLKDGQKLHYMQLDNAVYPIGYYKKNFYYLAVNHTVAHVRCIQQTFDDPENEAEDINSTSAESHKLRHHSKLKKQMVGTIAIILQEHNHDINNYLNQLCPFYNEIDDYHFLLENAIRLCQHNVEFKPLLLSLRLKIQASEEKLKSELHSAIIKLEIYEYIQLNCNENYYNNNIFEYDYKDLCIMFISNSDLDLATITWLKWLRMHPILTVDIVEDILNCTPCNIKMNALMVWLKNFIPSLLDTNPFYTDLFVKWTTERVFSMESSTYWPKISIKFIDEIMCILKSAYIEITVRPSSVDDLDVLKLHLCNIKELKEKYNINILIGELSSQTPAAVALIMLHRCYSEDLELLLRAYLPAYAARYSLELDDILRSHVEREVARSGGAADDNRLAILFAAFQSRTHRFDCLLHALRILDVPWSPAVQKIAVTAAAEDNGYSLTDTDRLLSREIQKEINYANLKIVLKKYNFPVDCTDYILVLHKVVAAIVVDLNDLKIVISVLRGYTGYGDILYIDRCLKDCNIKMALDYYNNLSKSERKILVKAVAVKYEYIVNDVSDSLLLERNYIGFLKGTLALDNIEMSDIESLYYLKNSYGINMNLNDMYCEAQCKNKFSGWNYMSQLVPKSVCNAYVSRLTRTRCLQMTTDMELMHYVTTCTNKNVRSHLETVIKLNVEENNESCDNHKESLMCSFKDCQNSQLLRDCCKVLIEIISNCAEEHTHFFVNIFSIFNTLANTQLILKNLSVVWKYNYIFIPVSAISVTDDLINFYIEINSKNTHSVQLHNFDTKSDFVHLRIFSGIIQKYLTMNDNYNYIILELRQKFLKKLLTKILACQDCDEVLLTSLLLMMCMHDSDSDSVSKSTLEMVLDLQSEMPATILTAYLSKPTTRRALGISDALFRNTNICTPHYLLQTKYSLNLADFPLPDVTEETCDIKLILFDVLNCNLNISLECLVDLCRALNVAIDDGVSLQLVSILLNWELHYKIYCDDLDRKQIIILNDEESLYCKCKVFWDSIKNKKTVIEILKDIWKNGEVLLYGRLVTINPYYYEVYLTIYNLLCSAITEWQTFKEYYLLYFLKQYRRVGSPKQYEFELFSVKGMFPEIGKYRLPFQLFMREDMWANLKSEITLETYERWLPAVTLLSLDADEQTARDMLCSNALKQTMTERKHFNEKKAEIGSGESWRLEAREEPLLRAAHRCVRHIANMEWAGACLFYVLQGCARGADQVAASQLCYQFAQRWAAVQPANRAVRQMQRLHSTLSIRHSLHKVEWACDELLRFSGEPTQLVRALYLHPEFVTKMSQHDLNRTANEIADNNGINIGSIRIQLLENILEQKDDASNRNTETLGLDLEELMRAKYILKATCPKMGAIYLARIALDDEVDFNKRKKLRALQCLISVVDPDTAVKVTNRERKALWEYLLELFYAVRLEGAGMPWAVATLAADKMRVLHQLHEMANGNIESQRLCAQLTRRYGSADFAGQLFSSLTRSVLLNELSVLLTKFLTSGDENVRNAWRAVLLLPFQRADYPITDNQRVNCLKAINMLPLYEDITDEDLQVIWKNCIRCKCFAIGCLILPYMTVKTRKTLSELEKLDKRNLIAGIKNLHTDSYLASSAMSILENLIYNPRLIKKRF